MTCKIKYRKKLLEKYQNSLMTKDEKDAFEKHLFECDDCFNEINASQAITNIIQEEGKEIFSGYVCRNKASEETAINKTTANWFRQYRWVSIPVAATVFLVAGFFVLSNRNTDSGDKNTALKIFKNQNKTTNPDVRKLEKQEARQDQNKKDDNSGQEKTMKDKLIAANFEESPNFENLIAQEIRSDINIEVISPVLSASFKKGEIQFKWKSRNKEQVFLEIYSNTEHKLFTAKTINNEYLLKIDLEEGLYYWKLVNEDNLLYIGKFRIKKQDTLI